MVWEWGREIARFRESIEVDNEEGHYGNILLHIGTETMQ